MHDVGSFGSRVVPEEHSTQSISKANEPSLFLSTGSQKGKINVKVMIYHMPRM